MLVPDVVQLNLMKKLQEGVLRRTLGSHARIERGGEEAAESEKRILNRLSEEQRKLGELMEQFIRKFGSQKQDDDRPEDGISFQDSDRSGDETRALAEIRKLMLEAEALLGRGASVDGQRRILEEIDRLLGDSEENQQGVIARILDLLKRAKAAPIQGSGPERRRNVPQSDRPITRPQPASREIPRSPFRSAADRTGWSAGLPPKERDAIAEAMNRRDLYLPEYMEMIRQYMETLMRTEP